MSIKQKITSILPNLPQAPLLALGIIPLIFSGEFLFPFITPRTIFFRLLVVAALLLGLAVLLKYSAQKEWFSAIKRQYITLAFTAYVASYALSGIFGVSFANSLFSDIERSWGIFTLMHMLAFLWIARIFLNKKSWFYFLNALFLGALGVALYGIFQYYPSLGIDVAFQGPGRIMSTTGNPAYTAMVLLFGISLGLLLMYQIRKSRVVWLYIAAVATQIYAFQLTGIRGAYLGVIAGVIAGLVVFAVASKKRNTRKYVLAGVGALVIACVLVFGFRESPIIKKIPIADRLARTDISDSTIKTRLMGWRAAWHGFTDKPILGYGAENYGTIFNKYFDAEYYTYAPSEPFFDRAHNHYLDVLSTLGIVGFLAYISIFIALIYVLFHGYRTKKLSHFEIAVCTGLFLSYAVHIMFVFDDLNALLYFTALLAYLEFRIHGELLLFEPKTGFVPFWKYVAFAAVAVIVAFGSIVPNVRIAQATRNTIMAVELMNIGKAQQSFAMYQQSLEPDYIIRKSALNNYTMALFEFANKTFSQNNQALKNLFVVNAAIVEQAYKREIEKNPYDALYHTKLATLYAIRFSIDRDTGHMRKALASAEAAIQLSPNRPQFHNMLSDFYVLFGEPQNAVRQVEIALEQNPRYAETYAYALRAYAQNNDTESAFRIFDSYVTAYSYTPVFGTAVQMFLNQIIASNNTHEAKRVLAYALENDSNNIQFLARAIVLALKNGDNQQAIEYVTQAGSADRSLADQAQAMISRIRAGDTDALIAELLR